MSDFRVETVDEFLERTGMSLSGLAKAMGVHRVVLNQYVKSATNSHLVRTSGDRVEFVRCERVMCETTTDKLGS